MSGVLSPAVTKEYQTAHNNLTNHHNQLFHAYNQTVAFVNRQAQALQNVQNRADAEELRLNAVVQLQDGHTLELARLAALVNQLSDRLDASERARAESEQARAELERARLEEKQANEDRFKKLEENSTGTTAIASQVNTLMERVATLEQQKEKYANRLLRAEVANEEAQKEIKELKVTVTNLMDIQEQLAINAVATHQLSASVDKKLDAMDKKLDRLLVPHSEGPLSSPAQTISGSPTPAAAGSIPGSPIRHPYSDVLSKILAMRTQQNPLPALPVAALGQPPGEATLVRSEP